MDEPEVIFVGDKMYVPYAGYKQLGIALHAYQVTVERAIAEGHDVAWLKAEVERLSK